MNDISKITPLEVVERENSLIQPPADSYNKAHNFVMRFNSWHSGKLTLPKLNGLINGSGHALDDESQSG